jgi:hypothetical protein
MTFYFAVLSLPHYSTSPDDTFSSILWYCLSPNASLINYETKIRLERCRNCLVSVYTVPVVVTPSQDNDKGNRNGTGRVETHKQSLVDLVFILLKTRSQKFARSTYRDELSCAAFAQKISGYSLSSFYSDLRFVCHLGNMTARLPLFSGQASQLGRTLQETKISISIYRPVHLKTSSICKRQFIDMFVISNITFHMRSILFIKTSKITRAVAMLLFVLEKTK